MHLLNPKKFAGDYPDQITRDVMLKTIDFFEGMGLKKIKADYESRRWYTEFLEFNKREKIFATILTPQGYGEGARWDSSRITDFAEILGFYGLTYWYCFQVSALGLGPIFLGDNQALKKKAAQLLAEGEIFAFGLSEKEHGADIYSSEMRLVPQPDGSYLAHGEKYYIGNGNKAAMVSTFGKIEGSDEYVFFVVNSQHEKYECVKNVINNQDYVAHYRLHDYPITDADITARGQKAWDDSLNTINIMKFNLGFASIGISTHAFHEALDHAANRKLFNHYVTDFVHIRQLFVDAYTRLTAMRLFANRATDYMRSASSEDRRYLLYNPMVKMKVTTQGEEVVNLLWDVIAAKGFEKDMYFENAALDIRALPKLEGTVHVNMALIVKFMANYFFKPASFNDVPLRRDAANDDFLFNQGATKGLGKTRFHDYRIAFNSCSLSNVQVFKKQVSTFRRMLMLARPNKEQVKDIDFLLITGELFTLVAYAQLLLESWQKKSLDNDLMDQIFDFMVRDFSKYALQLYSKTASTGLQQLFCKRMLRKPVVDEQRFNRVWNEFVYAKKGSYTMNPGEGSVGNGTNDKVHAIA
ncbi:MAG: acyl-CoA/acyl-ACP dehydrogenase [Gammaproteobacteria bacterium]|nr:acyl-CoA/acyl-ACP dehydrogenase [Gammaproteobacteria bacterium]MBT8151200.1 acyl-CoA/acyl-ACP dehydrogenase [Gammaproteobacteria bacterium]NNL11392.1 acyl-CoA dehydrogenase [Pseudomonadales bacterium]NNM10481.1 acyl-CoA dehydrogenase [Pseudomonadales bacterium]